MGVKKNNICIICEDVKMPFDEGIKKTIACLIDVLRQKRNVGVFGRDISSIIGKSYRTNRLLFSPALIKAIKAFNPDVVVYTPEASLTLGAFLRGRIISSFIKQPMAIIGLQTRKYGGFTKILLPILRPDLVLTQSKISANFYSRLVIRAGFIHSGIDTSKFRPVSDHEKLHLRKKYRLPIDKKILLHVGHLKEARGVKDIVEIAHDSAHSLFVGSTSTARDDYLKQDLQSRGVTIIDKFIEPIEEIYQAADLYVFPTKNQEAAIEFPLSVLEAMACNLPVLTTRYGSLVDYFAEDDGFRYYDSLEEGRKMANILLSSSEMCAVNNVAKIIGFSWENVANDLLRMMDEL